MPIRDASLYIEECIDSIISQDYENWELLAVNDHSTDSTWNILQAYANKDNRIKPTNNIGKGIIPALQTAYQLSSGAYITRMDADDRMSPNKLSSLYNILQSNVKANLATGKVKYFSDTQLGNGYLKYESWLNNLCVDNSHFSEIYKECVIPSPCWMISRNDFDRSGAFDSDTYPEDYDLCFRFYKSNMKVVASQDTLHYWRDYLSRSSRTDPNYKDNRFLSLKTKYFLELDYQKSKLLYLWGAGKKAKMIARLLLDSDIHFNWISNNTKKIGKDIYGIKIQNQSDLSDNTQVIIAIANEQEKLDIQEILAQKKQVLEYFFS